MSNYFILWWKDLQQILATNFIDINAMFSLFTLFLFLPQNPAYAVMGKNQIAIRFESQGLELGFQRHEICI